MPSLTQITIKSIDHWKHRYDTVGDWKFDKSGRLREILVSKMNNSDYEFLVAVHELIEAYLCQRRGITDEDVTRFDSEFEANRKEGDDSEPGDAAAAPYFKEHQFATRVERMIAEQLGVDWEAYEKRINEL